MMKTMLEPWSAIYAGKSSLKVKSWFVHKYSLVGVLSNEKAPNRFIIYMKMFLLDFSIFIKDVSILFLIQPTTAAHFSALNQQREMCALNINYSSHILSLK